MSTKMQAHADCLQPSSPQEAVRKLSGPGLGPAEPRVPSFPLVDLRSIYKWEAGQTLA